MRLLAFDFDGTLADTGDVIMRTIAQTLTQLGQAMPAESALKKYIGLPLAKIFEEACRSRDEKLISEAVRIYRSRFPENCGSDLRLYPGVRDTLDSLGKNGNVLAIASSRERNSLLSLTDRLGITGDFAIIAGEQDVPHHKPEPDIANFVLKRAGIPAESAMFIGDTIFDIKAGRAAGMKTCGVSYGNHTKAQLLEAGADYVIDEMPGLVGLISTI